MSKQPSLFGSPNQYGDLQPPAQQHSETSKAAAEAIKPHLNELQQRVLDYLREQGSNGATDEEMQDNIPLKANTQRPRRRELQACGLIRESGDTRKTHSGCAAAVWVAVRKESNGTL